MRLQILFKPSDSSDFSDATMSGEGTVLPHCFKRELKVQVSHLASSDT